MRPAYYDGHTIRVPGDARSGVDEGIRHLVLVAQLVDEVEDLHWVPSSRVVGS